MRRPVRIANCSGFYGDRRSAAREMVDGGPIDVLTGDWLSELTMTILAGAQARPNGVGWARTFLPQLGDVLRACVANGTRIVSNAGGLDPAGCAEAVRALADRLGLAVAVAHVTGDDLRAELSNVRPRVEGTPIAANAYLGGWGIARALAAGADVVVTGRVTDASLVVGPAAWWHDWDMADFDALAGAVAAGHVIECGAQATGGNYPFLDEIVDRRAPGFPLAEVAADGSSTITKHPDTGGLVSVGTVTAQLLYEIGPPAYPNPDVTAHFDTVTMAADGPDRVRLAGTRGSAPPADLKVAVATAGGHRNTMTLVLTGLDIEEKATRAQELVFARLGGRDRFDEVEVDLVRFDRPDAPTNPQATAHLRITVKDHDRDLVGRTFSDAIVEQALASYAGFHTTTPPTPASAFGVFTAASVPRAAVQHVVVLPDGSREVVADPPTATAQPADRPDDRPDDADPAGTGTHDRAPTRHVPLGAVCGARSGDKGGDANVGLWARDDAAWPWLRDTMTTGRLRELLGPEARDLAIERHELPNLRALNVVVRGLLGDGVASSTRPDPQAKGLGEYLRSRLVDVPERLLDHATGTGASSPPGTRTIRRRSGRPGDRRDRRGGGTTE